MLFSIASVYFILGAIFGSFYNVVIYRLPKKETIVHGRSHCMNCHHELKAWDLIPILSFFMLGRKCRYCKTELAWRYPLVELLTAFSFLLAYLRFGLTLQSLVTVLFFSCLIIVSFIDIDTLEIYDRFHVIILMLGVLNIILNQSSWISHIIGFAAVSVPLLVLALLTQGMGGGDIKLVAALGFFLAYPQVLVMIILAVISAALVGIILLKRKTHSAKSEIPFGPFLCIASGIALLYGPIILNWYLNLFN